MMPLNHILRKCAAGYKLSGLQEKINHLMYMDDIKLSKSDIYIYIHRCCKGYRGTAELLYIDQHILNESKTRRKKLAIAWIDYKKTYDIVSHSWIINYLKISHEVINLIDKTMKTWRVRLTAGGRSLAETKIQSGIFQGDAT